MAAVEAPKSFLKCLGERRWGKEIVSLETLVEPSSISELQFSCPHFLGETAYKIICQI